MEEEAADWDFVAMGMNYHVPFIRWVRGTETWAEESRSDVNGPTATCWPWPSVRFDLPSTRSDKRPVCGNDRWLGTATFCGSRTQHR
jgi:hypothetical protein